MCHIRCRWNQIWLSNIIRAKILVLIFLKKAAFRSGLFVIVVLVTPFLAGNSDGAMKVIACAVITAMVMAVPVAMGVAKMVYTPNTN